jgi:hypothetical protein
MIRAFWLALVGLIWALAAPATAQTRLFSTDAPLRITLTAPFPTLVRAAKTKLDPYPATLTVTDGTAPAQNLAIQIRPRGISRRVGGFCTFPPLQLRFGDKAALKETVFRGQKKLKLVTYCQDHDDYEQRIMLEYLAYRLYNTVTPMSYRVRAAQVTYRSSDQDKGVTRFGYLIEDIDDLADRNHAKVLELKPHQITAAQFDARGAIRAAMLEYMIGNLDWDFLGAAAGQECCHNSRFVAASDQPPLKGVTPLVYDFDFSGFVDSPYAGPPVGLPVQKITDRLYRGYCANNAEIPAVVDEYKAHRADMMGLINGQPGLDARVKAKTVRFMDGFFTTLDDPAKVESQIVKRCR